jgi:4-amino-4-deoxy-L-arabinose transferase-like glycosyltransferase
MDAHGLDLGLALCIGFAARLVALPFAMSEDADAAARTWIAWQWLENPYLITDGVWAPLHFYILAVPLLLFGDPLYPVIMVHVTIATLAAVFLYLFLINEFEDRSAALMVTVLFLLYPVYLRASLMATAEVPFIFFFLLCLFLLSLARRPGGQWWHALLAGFAMTLAGMLRYDAWLLTPFLAAALWRRPYWLIPFLGAAAIFPALWMFGNWSAHGDPFYFISRDAMDVADREEGDGSKRLWQGAFYPAAVFFGLTPIVAIIAGIGAAMCMLRRAPQAVWLLPAAGLLVIFSVKSGEAHIPLKARYTISIGTLVLCYAAEVFKLQLFRRSSGAWKLACIGAVAASMLVFSYLDRLALPNSLSGVFRASFHAVPRAKYGLEVEATSHSIRRHLHSDRDAFISDYLGLSPTFLIALETRLHPRRIFFAPGERYPRFEPDQLTSLLKRHKQGVLLLKPSSWFANLIGHCGEGHVTMAGNLITLERFDERRIGDAAVILYRYNVVSSDSEGRADDQE